APDSGSAPVDAAAPTDAAPEPAPPPLAPGPTAGGDTLWIGNSLMRFQAAGPYPAYDIPGLVQSMRGSAAAAGDGPLQTARVLAADGFGLEGWWNSYYGYSAPDGSSVSAARAIVEDPAHARSYDSDLGYTALPSDHGGWDRIIVLSLLNYLGEDRWYGDPDSGAV